MKRALRILAISYIGYLLLVLLVVTPALNLAPPWLVKKYLGRELHSEIVWFNPFTLSLELRRTEVPEHDGSRFLGLDRARVDLSVASLWRGALVFDEVSIEQLYVNLVELADGQFNFSDMIPPSDPQAAPTGPESIPA
ncbi:MAG: AsmA family protein, partial [Halioglobus sp.]|nr:AsmA family protein [Halioglobus sp.]